MRTQMLRRLGPLFGATHDLTPDPRARLAIAGVPGPDISQREYAVFLLSMAAEIEHSLMAQYLYSAWSLGGPQVPLEHRADVETWRRLMLGIAKEEMGHLLTVQNLLRLIGGPVHLDREDFPWISGFYPYAFHLEPATLKSVAKYVVAESPDVWPGDKTERDKIKALAVEDAGMQVGRVGVLYGKLIDMFADDTALRDEDFQSETYAHQASFDDWGRGYAAGARARPGEPGPDILALRAANRGQAVYALKQVAEQGESPGTLAADQEDSHFTRFLTIWRGLEKASDWSACLPLPVDPTLPGPGAGDNVISNPESQGWAALFNLRYRMLLTYLGHALNLGASEPVDGGVGRRGFALNRVFNEMYFLKTIAGLLTRRPLADDPERPAGPPFQMPYTLNFPIDEADFWRLHLDLVNASIESTRELEVNGADGEAFLAALRGSDQTTRAELAAILAGGRRS